MYNPNGKKEMSRAIFVLLLVFLQVAALFAQETTTAPIEIYVCDSAEPEFLGTYIQSKASNDGAPTYSNANDMSFFRNKGFWYLGNLGPWPPATHYRCVEHDGCNWNENTPPNSAEGKWAVGKAGKSPIPTISLSPCAVAAGEEL